MKISLPFEYISPSPEETEKIGAAFGEYLKNETSAFLAMYGDLGAGKTCFTRGLCSVLSPESRVKSPTFSIVNEYRNGDTPIYHYDMYRISSDDDLYSTGFYDIDEGIIVAEWSENIPYAVPKDCYKIEILHMGEERKITIKKEDN